MAINVNEEGVMKPLTIDGAQTTGFTINGIELLFKGALNRCDIDDAPNKGTKIELPRDKADYKYIIIITAIKMLNDNTSYEKVYESIAVVDMEAFLDGACGRAKNSDDKSYFQIYMLSTYTSMIMLKKYINGSDTNIYFCCDKNSVNYKYYHTIFGLY